jgi:hypothetical protein
MSKNSGGSGGNRGFGLSVVMLFGGLARWYRGAQAADTLGFLDRRPEKTHGTCVSCTPPNCRSVASEEQVLRLVEPLRPKLLRLMPAVVEGMVPFELTFRAALVTGGTVILPSAPHPRILDLKARLQGDRHSIPEKDVPGVLASDSCLGVDKFSTGSPGEGSLLRPSVSITLGETRAHDVLPCTGTGVWMTSRSPPASISGLRDRRLRGSFWSSSKPSPLLELVGSLRRCLAVVRCLSVTSDNARASIGITRGL